MQDFEKLAAFYLGKGYDLAEGQLTDELLLYDAKDLTTHAVCVGMTGSGKTGLCLSLLEEAAIDGIPVIALDPKGDIGNLLLSFPNLRPSDFAPWVESSEAVRQGMSVDQFAAHEAKRWREGLAQWGQDASRIARFRDAVDIAIYTPGSDSGLPLTVLQSFAAPPAAVIDDSEAFRVRVNSAASGLLALMGVTADPLRSREHILIANLLEHAWKAGRGLDMGDLIRGIQSPPFDKVGFMDVETVFPAADRFQLAMQLNNLLASPGFSNWLQGEALDINNLLYTPKGKPRVSILSVSHLSDSERMFFVTILLNELVSWMRTQQGTSSLRALFYMDEVFGYFPPTAKPPSKTPMLTLLKQARAYGLGVVLATQNPVDLDYKGLSNAGTWFLGRLQTERDIGRVLDGLEGAATTAGAGFDRKQMESALAGLGRRVFVMNNVHDDQPIVFQSRWALSYLRGPLTRNQIKQLTGPHRNSRVSEASSQATAAAAALSGGNSAAAASNLLAKPESSTNERPLVPPKVPEFFFPRRAIPSGVRLLYRPALLGTARLHYISATSKVDMWQSIALLADVRDIPATDVWNSADLLENAEPELDSDPDKDGGFGELPPEYTRVRNYASWGKSFKEFVYREKPLTLWKSSLLKTTSKPGESERDFRVRLRQDAVEHRDLKVEKLRKSYTSKLQTLTDQIRRAEERVDREKSQYRQSQFQTVISFGSSILGALLGRKIASVTNVGRAATAMRGVSRSAKEHGDIGNAEENLETLKQRMEDLESQFKAEVSELEETLSPDNIELDKVVLRPRKSDIAVGVVALVWMPWQVDSDGIATPAHA